MKNLPAAVVWLVSPFNWWLVVQDLGHSLQRNSVLWIFGLLAAGMVIGSRRWVKEDLARVASRVYSVKTDSFVLTLRALGLTALLAFGWPILMGTAAWPLLKLPLEEPEIKISQIDEQNRTLLRTVMLFAALIGLWAIWAEILPTLNILQKVQLWTYQMDVDGVTKTLPVTLGSVITGVLVAALTYVSARNIPGVLEITLLKRLPMDAGTRHALTTIYRYAIRAVGIAYGSDTALADKLLRQVAADHPQVLDEPASSAYFLGFGDNSLNFELRVYIDEPLNRIQVISDLHRAIDDVFREADIEISFPQRDGHLDQTGPLEVRVVQEQETRKKMDRETITSRPLPISP